MAASAPPAAAMPVNLLATRLFVPPARTDLVPRPRLFDRIQRGLQGKLTVIAVPAGFGKTTLLSGWRSSAGENAPRFALLQSRSAWTSTTAARSSTGAAGNRRSRSPRHPINCSRRSIRTSR
jgi:hypothetical protein